MKGNKMDSARPPRMFGGYTLEYLKNYIKQDLCLDPKTLGAINKEIEHRESGASVHFSTPQVT
jgi:hypothetical protein